MKLSKAEAISLFQAIQSGRGVGDFFEEFPFKGDWAQWTPEFSLGCEYGFLIALRKIYSITNQDLGWSDEEVEKLIVKRAEVTDV